MIKIQEWISKNKKKEKEKQDRNEREKSNPPLHCTYGTTFPSTCLLCPTFLAPYLFIIAPLCSSSIVIKNNKPMRMVKCTQCGNLLHLFCLNGTRPYPREETHRGTKKFKS